MKSEFFLRYRKSIIKGLPKYAELREILRTAIDDGYWEKGEKLPPEVKIAELTPFSLGTVQKALKELVAEGVVERRQGHGSFVTDKQIKMADPWHFRFSSDLFGDYMEVYPMLKTKKRVVKHTDWARLLNPDDGSLVQIDRIISIGNKFTIYSKFFLSGNKFEDILRKSDKELTSMNLKSILHQEYNVRFSNILQTFKIISFSEAVCRLLGVEKGTEGLLMELLANSKQKTPIYYQKVYIPPNDFKLTIADASKIPEKWR